MIATTLYLLRHAQSRPLAEQTEEQWALSETGTAQAEGLVSVLRDLGVQRVYSSPFRRCRDTLAPFARHSGLSVVTHDGLREIRLSNGWIGDFRDVWRRTWEDFSYKLEGGECAWDCHARVVAGVKDLVARHAGETLLLGSHGYSISLFMHHVDPSFHEPQARALRTPEILKIVHRDGVFVWDRTFSAGAEFDRLATDFRKTPGIVA